MYLIITRWNQPKGMLSRLICHSTVTYPHHASHSYLSCHQHFLALTAPTIRLSPNCCTILCDKIVFCDKICFMWQNYVFLWQKMFYVTKYVVCDQMCVTWQNMFYVTQCFMWQNMFVFSFLFSSISPFIFWVVPQSPCYLSNMFDNFRVLGHIKAPAWTVFVII